MLLLITICSRSPIGRDRGLKIPPVRVRIPLRAPIWGLGVIGNIKDSDSFVLGSRPKGPAKMASSYNGSIGDFESFGVGPIPALAANKLKINVVDANIGGVR